MTTAPNIWQAVTTVVPEVYMDEARRIVVDAELRLALNRQSIFNVQFKDWVQEDDLWVRRAYGEMVVES